MAGDASGSSPKVQELGDIRCSVSSPASDAHLVGHKVPEAVESEDAEQSDHEVVQPLLVLPRHLPTPNTRRESPGHRVTQRGAEWKPAA